MNVKWKFSIYFIKNLLVIIFIEFQKLIDHKIKFKKLKRQSLKIYFLQKIKYKYTKSIYFQK